MHRLSDRRRGQTVPLRHHADADLETGRRILLQSLSVQDFRCFERANWAPGEGLHLLVGENGAGKTSILEAIYFLATTRSFRTGRLKDCLRWQRGEFWVRGRLTGARGDELAASWRPGGAQRTIHGKTADLGDYLSRLPAFAWSTRDDPLLDGEPEARRRLMDQGIVARKPLEVEVLSRYRRVLAAKRRLLAERGETRPSETLETWNTLLAEAGCELIRLRGDYVRELQEAFDQVVSEHQVEFEPIRFEYRPSPEASGSKDEFLAVLESEKSREIRRARALVGPHRDRLAIRWGMSDIGRSASAGERKLFGLVLTAARRRILQAAGREPIVLLDDLDATLDGGHLDAAWRLFEGAPQVVASSTDPETGRRFPGVTCWRLDGARIVPM